jgi:hypothetical protein
MRQSWARTSCMCDTPCPLCAGSNLQTACSYPPFRLPALTQIAGARLHLHGNPLAMRLFAALQHVAMLQKRLAAFQFARTALPRIKGAHPSHTHPPSLPPPFLQIPPPISCGLGRGALPTGAARAAAGSGLRRARACGRRRARACGKGCARACGRGRACACGRGRACGLRRGAPPPSPLGTGGYAVWAAAGPEPRRGLHVRVRCVCVCVCMCV